MRYCFLRKQLQIILYLKILILIFLFNLIQSNEVQLNNLNVSYILENLNKKYSNFTYLDKFKWSVDLIYYFTIINIMISLMGFCKNRKQIRFTMLVYYLIFLISTKIQLDLNNVIKICIIYLKEILKKVDKYVDKLISSILFLPFIKAHQIPAGYPNPPNEFRSEKHYADYLTALNAYYQIFGRPRLVLFFLNYSIHFLI